MKRNELFFLCAILVLLADAFLWRDIFASTFARSGIYFFPVGTGESALSIFPSGVKVLVDAGPDGSLVKDLARILPSDDRYIDVAFANQSSGDFGGYMSLLDDYRIGVFVWSGFGAKKPNASWEALLSSVRSRKIPIITLARGDGIASASSSLDILAPDDALAEGKAANDGGFVIIQSIAGMKAIFTADVGPKTEKSLLLKGDLIRADILEVAHHGSKTSSIAPFLNAVKPSIAVIEVDADNRYGYPASTTMTRISTASHALIFRTDRDGIVGVVQEGGKLAVQRWPAI